MSFSRTKAFDIAELIRVFKYDKDSDKIINETSNTKLATVKEFERSTTDQFVMDSFNKNEVLAAKYVISMSKTGKDHTAEVLISHNGTDVRLVEYAVLHSHVLGTLSVVMDGDIIKVRCTPEESDTTIKFQRTTVDA